MTARAEQLFSEAMKLPSADRTELVELLAASLEPAVEEPLSPEWQEEIDRRVADIRSGRNLGRPIEYVVADLRARLK